MIFSPEDKKRQYIKSSTPTARNVSSVPALGYYQLKPLFLFIWNGEDGETGEQLVAFVIARDVLEARATVVINSKDSRLKKLVEKRAPTIANKPEAWTMTGNVARFEMFKVGWKKKSDNSSCAETH